MSFFSQMQHRIHDAAEQAKRMRTHAAMKVLHLDPKDIVAIRKVADDIDAKGFKSAANELRLRAKRIEQGFR